MEKPESLKDWKCLLGAKLVPMDEQTSKMLITLTLAKENAVADFIKECRDKSLGLGVLVKRLEFYGYAAMVSPNTIVFLASLCRNPAMAVMWAYTLGLMLEKRNWTRITMSEVCKDEFGMGFPDESEYHRIWDEQKVPRKLQTRAVNDNYIDIMPWPLPPTK